MSSRKNASIPLNRSPENGCITALPASPLRNPTAIAPSSSTCVPSVNDSCSTLPIGVEGPRPPRVAAAAPPDTGTTAGRASDCRSMFANATAIRTAGDSIATIATAMWPPNAMPLVSRYCIAVTNVTALTDPYDAATAAAS